MPVKQLFALYVTLSARCSKQDEKGWAEIKLLHVYNR